jgi:hypothetical protein
MRLNPHYGLTKQLAGTHALLSPSKPAWLNYDTDKLDRTYFNAQAAQRGTDEHAWAHESIRLKMRQIENSKAINQYVNDGIGFRMLCEFLLFFTDNCYGHADTFCFREDTLRIHDYKSGVGPTDMRQLEIYAALFCLEYGMRPFDIKMELRIYQGNQVKVHAPDADDIFHIMDRITSFDRRLNELKGG